ncbi:MAG TPA: ABC transporter permease, partial [Bacteroidota bacterium]|nr:ABC transporter permease [Bacteroidota bacterium]
IMSAFRTLRRHKWNTSLNVVGLSIGLASGALILMDIQYELSYDAFYPNTDRIYRVYTRYPGRSFRGSEYYALIPAPAAPAMVAELPEIESAVRFLGFPHPAPVRAEATESKETFVWCESTVFSIFDIPLLAGDPATALREPRTAVISESAARRLFGERDPIGKTIHVSSDTVRVTGIMKDMPQQSHVMASVYVSLATAFEIQHSEEKWDFPLYTTYLLLKKGSDPESLRGKCSSFVKTHLGPVYNKLGVELPQYFVQPLKDIHLASAGINHGPQDVGDVRTILILSALALVLLATASINYANLATARASLRARELGIRKVIGARRGDLVRQFLGESLLTAMVAGCLALFVAELFLPSFSNLTGKEFSGNTFLNGEFLAWFFFLTVAVGLLAGSFPAFVLSAFSPAAILRGLAVGRGKSRLRDALVVIQFTAAIGLAICAFTIFSQLSFIQTTDTGYNRKQVLSIRIRNVEALRRSGVFIDQAKNLSGVAGITATSDLPINIQTPVGIPIRNDEGRDVYMQSYWLLADDAFFDVYQIPLLRGRAMSGGPVVSDDAEVECVVNETFARAAGLKDPIGKQFPWQKKMVTVVGVMKDFNLQSFRQPIAPLVIAQPMGAELYLSIRAHTEGLAGTIQSLRDAWKNTIGDNTFAYFFVDDTFSRMYQTDEKFGQTVLLFTLLALFIGAMGLLGLATFMVQARRKEIAIRKVFGATSVSVTALLSREFLILVGVSNILAAPVAYYMMHRWLSNFSYRIAFGPEPFILAGCLATGLVFLTVSIQALRAANVNPVESLRHE